MADVFTRVKRSDIMKKVKSSGNLTTEQNLIAIFKSRNIKGWRRNYPITGKPDFVFLDTKIAVFADGCFWHGHHCRNISPKQNADYWRKKQLRNIERDRQINLRFQKRGWSVLRFWECKIKNDQIDLTPLY